MSDEREGDINAAMVTLLDRMAKPDLPLRTECCRCKDLGTAVDPYCQCSCHLPSAHNSPGK